MTQRFVDKNLQPVPSRTRTSLLPLKQQGNAPAEEDAIESLQHITFRFNGYLFALPSQDVLRVVATPSPEQGGFIAMGMVQLGPYSIQILDLAVLLELKQPEKQASKEAVAVGEDADENPPFLLVLKGAEQTDEKRFWGIALPAPPDLMDVPLYALKPVPAHQRLTPSLKWISHIVSYDLDSQRRSLLILDLSLITDAGRQSQPTVDTFDVKEITPPLDVQPKGPVPLKLQEL